MRAFPVTGGGGVGDDVEAAGGRRLPQVSTKGTDTCAILAGLGGEYHATGCSIANGRRAPTGAEIG